MAESPPEPSAVKWRVITVYQRPVDQQERVDSLLIVLRCLGFQFAVHRGPGGVVVALTGFRAHHGVIDVVQLYGENDVDAIRVPGDKPDMLFPRVTVWRATGTANEVIDNLLNLSDPEPAERGMPRQRPGFRTFDSVFTDPCVWTARFFDDGHPATRRRGRGSRRPGDRRFRSDADSGAQGA